MKHHDGARRRVLCLCGCVAIGWKNDERCGIVNIYESKQKAGLLNMPIPRLNMPKHKLTEDGKMLNVISKLCLMGYEVCEAKNAIRIIEMFDLDKSQFDFPYGSFDEAKKHALAGEFDYDEESFSSSEEEIETLHKEVEEGKLWVTY